MSGNIEVFCTAVGLLLPRIKDDNCGKRPMGAKVTICCCHYCLKHSGEEKNAILRMRKTPASGRPELLSSESSDTDAEEEEEESGFGETRENPRCQQTTPDRWITPDAVRRGSDRELRAFISMRDQADKATEEWEKLNYDIHTLCYARREVRSRWKKILLQLGYQREADALLRVNRQVPYDPDREHLNRAADLLKQLLDHTSLFPPGTGHQNRYVYVMDRLVSLDSAEEFIRLAKDKYPKK